MMSTRVFLVDDHEPFRYAITQWIDRLPGMSVVGGARCGQQALDQIQKLKPDLVVLDIALPGLRGIAVVERLDTLRPALPIVMYSAYSEVAYVRRSRKEHAHGRVLKGDPHELQLAIKKVLAGGIYISPALDYPPS